MGRAIELPGENPTFKAHPKMTFRKGEYSYTVETVGDKSTYTVTDGISTISVPIRWAFGAGGQTWVLERGGKFYDSLVSYYPAIAGLDITMGEERITPHTVEEAMGRELGEGETKACFGCHATNALSDRKLSLEAMEPGVTCEHCHVGANAHLLDAIQGEFDSAPPKLGKLSSEDVSTFCGQCHHTWESVLRGHLDGEVNVRFQPYRLSNSKCFDGADPRISCLACHDPHQDVVREDASYDSKCLTCHSSSTRPASVAGVAGAPACPVAKQNCVSCHMPKVNLPGGHQAFTDHQIRIVRTGEPYPN
jgi:formate-dependent nitrite reductase cytochrome c552 subunit